MRKATKTLWHVLQHHITHWVVGGTVLVLTGFTPEEWLARTARRLNIPEEALHLWVIGIDARIVAVVAGMCIIIVALLRQRQPAASMPAHSPSNLLSGSPVSHRASSATQSPLDIGSHTGPEGQARRLRAKPVGELLDRFSPDVLNAAASTPFTVLLCGPTLNDLTKPSAGLCSRLKHELEAKQFDVVLGEDNGLQDARLQSGVNAQDNELEFAQNTCGAVILIADSAGAFCELGVFSWHYANTSGMLNRTDNKIDCILLMDSALRGHKNYLSRGPAAKVNATGLVDYVDFASYDPQPILDRLQQRRALLASPKRRSARRRP